jgi:hypothetical protein
MTKSKNTSKNLLWQRFSQTLKPSKRIWIYFLLFIIFFLSIAILWKKYSENKTLAFSKVKVENSKLENPEPIKEMVSAVGVIQKDTQGSSQKLITIQLLEGVLEGWIPLSTFKTYLQKHSDEDTPNLLLELSTISNCSTYAELQSSLPSVTVKSKSLWERLKSLIRIKKIDKGKALETNSPKKIERAIYEKNIPEVLNLFEKLPENEKGYFSSWMKKVQERLKVEMLYKNLLIKLAQGQNG